MYYVYLRIYLYSIYYQYNMFRAHQNSKSCFRYIAFYLFSEDKEEYEPTPQETEELERALEAVDKDVKSLEKLSQTQGILDTLLDEQTIAQTLAQLPEVTANLEVPQTLVPVFYHNGFSNINQLEQTLQDVNKSLTQTVLLNQGSEAIANHFNSLTIPNHADVLQS